jgi:hypothetical protein
MSITTLLEIDCGSKVVAVDCLVKICQIMRIIPTKFMTAKNNMKSIVIVLQDSLRVYSYDGVVKSDGVEFVCELEKESGKPVLDLFDRFSPLWQRLTDRRVFEGVGNIYFVLGSRAGFTDTRVVYLWLKSWEMFGGGKQEFWVHNETREINIGLMDGDHLEAYLVEAKKHGSKQLLRYSREPSVGR